MWCICLSSVMFVFLQLRKGMCISNLCNLYTHIGNAWELLQPADYASRSCVFTYTHLYDASYVPTRWSHCIQQNKHLCLAFHLYAFLWCAVIPHLDSRYAVLICVFGIRIIIMRIFFCIRKFCMRICSTHIYMHTVSNLNPYFAFFYPDTGQVNLLLLFSAVFLFEITYQTNDESCHQLVHKVMLFHLFCYSSYLYLNLKWFLWILIMYKDGYIVVEILFMIAELVMHMIEMLLSLWIWILVWNMKSLSMFFYKKTQYISVLV